MRNIFVKLFFEVRPVVHEDMSFKIFLIQSHPVLKKKPTKVQWCLYPLFSLEEYIHFVPKSVRRQCQEHTLNNVFSSKCISSLTVGCSNLESPMMYRVLSNICVRPRRQGQMSNNVFSCICISSITIICSNLRPCR